MPAEPTIEIAPLAPETVEALERALALQRRHGAGAGAPRPRRSGGGARIPGRRRSAPAGGVSRHRGRGRSRARARCARFADHRARRLRLRRRLRHGDPGRRSCAELGADVGLAPPGPPRRRLRPRGGDCRSSRRARHRAPDHGRLRDHGGRRGGAGARRRDRRPRHRPSQSARGRGASRRAARAPACSAAIHARTCAPRPWPPSSRRRCASVPGWIEASAATSSSSSHSRRSRTSSRCAARTAASCARGSGRSRRPCDPACER